MAPAVDSRSASIERQLAALSVYGSKPEWLDDAAISARAGAAYDRCYDPAGVARQARAVVADGSRADGLRALDLPVLVIHGSRDTLIDPSGGRRTAELIRGARYLEIDGMGHDYPPAVWATWVTAWAEFVRDTVGV
jgi:pimeloyl-ACP methyl ester carboxylesterase